MSWMHPMDANETPREKSRLELHKNATCCFEQFLEVTLHKTEAIRPLTSHLKNHPRKTDYTGEPLLKK